MFRLAQLTLEFLFVMACIIAFTLFLIFWLSEPAMANDDRKVLTGYNRHHISSVAYLRWQLKDGTIKQAKRFYEYQDCEDTMWQLTQYIDYMVYELGAFKSAFVVCYPTRGV